MSENELEFTLYTIGTLCNIWKSPPPHYWGVPFRDISRPGLSEQEECSDIFSGPLDFLDEADILDILEEKSPKKL